jgi:peptidoglycan/xylan/chitin deacetylase (PgdA/CDA1 family)
LALVAGVIAWALPASSASATDPVPIVSPVVVVTIGFDDGTVDQFAARTVLAAHGMNATFFINSGPIAAGDPDHMTVAELGTLAAMGNEIGGHTVDHANIQPLSPTDAMHEVCDDRTQLTQWGVQEGFPAPTSFAYPFGSWDSNAETIVAGCGYDSARTVSGVSIHVSKNKLGETIPPVDPYATRTPPNPKKATKLSTMERYVTNAEGGVAATGQSLWIQFVFHRYCDAHCGAYTIQPAKFTALLDFLQVQQGENLVSVLTTAQAMALS